MEKVTIKDLITFRRKSESSKKMLAHKLKHRVKAKKKPTDGGGDYWVSCLSAIGNSYRDGDINLLQIKIDLLTEKIKLSGSSNIKAQFQRNIDILNNFRDFDFESIRPEVDLIFHKQSKIKSIIEILGFPIESKPNHIFSFTGENREEIGAVWFVAKLDGYKKMELGMFTEIMYLYLEKHFSTDYVVNPFYCVAIDVFNGHKVRYENILKREIPFLIKSTLTEIKRL